MKKIKIGIVEDEGVIAENLLAVLEDIGYDTCEPASSFEEGLEMIKEEMPDLVLLDIMIQGDKDGIDLAQELKENYNIPFIFLTSSSDPLTLEKAKKVNPPAYLVKPFNRDDLYTSIEIALSNFKKLKSGQNEKHVLKETLFVKDKDLFKKVAFSEIIYMKSDHVYIDLITKEGKYVIRSTMGEILEKLDSSFFRTHRSIIVNLNHVDYINGEILVLGEHRVPIAKNYRDELISKLNLA